MRQYKKIALWLLLAALAFALCACGPDEDTTDELISSSVDVPFNTTGLLTTPRPMQVTGWFGESVTLYEDEYSVLTLDPPSIGDNVRTLQRRLIELNYLSSEKNTKGEYKRVNGKFDAATEQAVEKFEANYGQSPTGVATELMQHYLFSEDAKSYYTQTAFNTPTPTPTPSRYPTATGYRYLQRGDSGDDVRALQQRLYDLGYLNYVSGTYDTATENAVSLFSSAYGQNTNGNATVEMQRTLFSASARSYQQMIASVTPTPSPTPTPDPYGGYATLKEGDRGAAVTNLQKRLRELGYMRSKADGLYGEKTVEAVMAFEATYGRQQTGIASAALQSVLFSDDALRYGAVTPTPLFTPTPEPSYSYTTLTYGSTGEEVLRLQLRLIELGYLSGGADGVFGDMTASAIKAFEQANGRTPTGVATSALQVYLFSDIATPAPSAAPTPTASGYQELSLGSSGQAVVNLQNRLSMLGYYSGVATGNYDAATAEAVQRFESAYGKAPTGVASAALQQYLYSDSARPYATATPTPYTEQYATLQKGDKGDTVVRLQERLTELGYLSGTIDGYFGEGTRQAVRYFEAAYGRAQTGVATNELQINLYSSSAKRNTSGNIAVSYFTLKSGDSGTAVKNLQNRLIQLGFMNAASGSYDQRTVNAVKSFQHLMGLSEDGIASSELQQTLFSSDAKDYSAEKVINVNRSAQVKTSSTGVYASFYDEKPSLTIGKGTALTVVRTRGIWAEVKNASGNVGYVLLSDLAYAADTSTPTPAPSGQNRVNVNKTAYISVDAATVYESASANSKKLGTLSKNQSLVWVATLGDWAEIRNDRGTITGYVKTSQLTLGTPPSGQPSPSASPTESAYGFTTFKKGAKGDEVKTLQTRLKDLGYHYADIGGNYLDKTVASVKRFQGEIGLSKDGVATPGLQDLLFCSYAPKYGTYRQSENKYTDMYSGRSDADVQKLQKRLVELGYLSSSGVSGVYDSATIKAVRQAQSALGLRDNSGIATRELQAFLYKMGDVIKK